MEFFWDPKKAMQNYKKHRVTFEEATLIFRDPKLLEELDTHNHDRLNLIGLAYRLLFVVCIDISEEDRGTFRIISARKATVKEKRRYAKNAKK